MSEKLLGGNLDWAIIAPTAHFGFVLLGYGIEVVTVLVSIGFLAVASAE